MALHDLDKVVTWWVPELTIRRALGRWLIRSEVFVALSCSGAACNIPAAP